ncbi:hypothetical protein BEP19_14525 [Ammoniphilus oxalaticus]|uniref:Peptidoglycan binding domain-containing protein n=1 Tax=Ammoniphilus oxalaticus TaxID=66863 RepID=A0A419SF24_9BACL|nr:VanW family protein [Ammoniphilus oxalaticus]RKD21824.1 hypothetical protein BEP19_14525 [Ammoniphilus oxalaticus]
MGEKKRFVRLGSLCLILAIALGGLYAYGKQTTIPIGYFFHDWHIGTLSPEQLKQQYPKRIAALQQKKIYFQLLEDSEIKEVSFTFKELGIPFNEQQVLNDILAYSKQEKLYKRIFDRMRGPDSKPFYLAPQWNEQKLHNALSSEWADVFAREPSNAERVFDEQDQISYKSEQSVFRPNISNLVIKLGKLEGERLWSEEKLAIVLPMEKLKPAITVEDLKSEGIDRKISEFSTHYSKSSSGRIHNVEKTAMILNDKMLEPGEVFSYKEIVDATETVHGYRAAPVIMDGELRPGIGGGVCQVSTTLYNAALLSDLEIVERRNHSLPIGYAPLGRDATFTNDGGIDFRFKNTTKNNLLIRAETKNGKLTVKIFGKDSDDDKQIEIFTERRSSHSVNVYKRVIVNGEVVNQELISSDTYRSPK